MRICLLTYRGNPFCGGQGVYVSALAAELSRQGHEVHCISGPPYPNETEGMILHKVSGPLLYNGAGAVSAPFSLRSLLSPLDLLDTAAFKAGIFSEMATFSMRAFPVVCSLLKRFKFDIIHDNQSLGWGLLPIKQLGVPLMATIHHPLQIDRERGFEPPTSFERQFRKMMFYPLFMQNLVARRIPALVTVSHASAREIESRLGIPPERIRVVYNGVDSELFRPIPGVRRVAGRVLFVGNVQDPNKGARYLFRAMAMLKPPAHLVVVTGGLSDPEGFWREIRDLELEGRVEVLTRLAGAELVKVYASAQVAVSPSLFEGFGFPAAEAMSCGLPLVAARGGALPEVVGDGGLLAPVRDAPALAEAIGKLLGEPALRKKLGRAGRRRVLERFQWKNSAAELVEFYQETINAYG